MFCKFEDVCTSRSLRPSFCRRKMSSFLP
jgi:hypothetical protein